MPDASWSLIIHGGAKTIDPDRATANRAGCLAAVEIGAAILSEGGSALDAVEAAIRQLEEDNSFNAGYGAVANTDGNVELDAAIMDGTTLDLGAVAAATKIEHPISVARLLLEERATLLVGDGADRFAASRGFRERGNAPSSQLDDDHDTVGAVARDQHGHMAAGSSTGGLQGQLPGRVGDSPLPGCGLYADDAVGAVSISGDGESIARVTLAARLMSTLEDQPLKVALQRAFLRLERIGGEAGMIALDRRGNFGVMHNSDHFAIALASSQLQPVAALHRDELKEMFDHD
jgi:beta-aspartyl-peptidase (threonine type)